MKSSWGTLWEH